MELGINQDYIVKSQQESSNDTLVAVSKERERRKKKKKDFKFLLNLFHLNKKYSALNWKYIYTYIL